MDSMAWARKRPWLNEGVTIEMVGKASIPGSMVAFWSAAIHRRFFARRQTSTHRHAPSVFRGTKAAMNRRSPKGALRGITSRQFDQRANVAAGAAGAAGSVFFLGPRGAGD